MSDYPAMAFLHAAYVKHFQQLRLSEFARWTFAVTPALSEAYYHEVERKYSRIPHGDADGNLLFKGVGLVEVSGDGWSAEPVERRP